MARSSFDAVEELRAELQKDLPAPFVVRLEYDLMRDHLHAWGRCSTCRARFHRIEEGSPAPLLTMTGYVWEDALPVPMPAEWLPLFTAASVEDKRAMEAMKAAHDRLNAPAKQVRTYIVSALRDAVRDVACACIKDTWA